MKNVFNVVFATLWKKPAKSETICSLPVGSLLLAEDVSGGFTKVTYRSNKDYVGWVETAILDEIVNPLPQNVVGLPDQTHSLQDLKQYITLFGNVQYNLCGQICVAMLVGDQFQNALEKWKVEKPSIFRRVFPKQASVPTGIPELASILNLYPLAEDPIDLRVALFEKVVGRPVITPARLAKWTEAGWKILIGCSIDARGRMSAKGTRHWIVVTRVEPMDILDGLVYFYNPASDSIQFKAWAEFFTSVGTPFGLMVKPLGV